MRRWVWGSAVALAVLLALARMSWRPQPVAGPARGDDGFVFLFAWESNNMAVRGLPRRLDDVPQPDFDAEARSLRVPAAADVPPPGAAAVILHRVDSLDTHLASRLYTVARVPARVAVGAPVARGGRVDEGRGGEAYVDNVVDNGARLLPPQMEVRAVEADGTIVFRLGEEEVRLRPGTGWGIGYVRGPEGVVAVADGPDWEERMGRYLRSGGPVTVFSVFNHGRWRRADLRVGSAASGG